MVIANGGRDAGGKAPVPGDRGPQFLVVDPEDSAFSLDKAQVLLLHQRQNRVIVVFDVKAQQRLADVVEQGCGIEHERVAASGPLSNQFGHQGNSHRMLPQLSLAEVVPAAITTKIPGRTGKGDDLNELPLPQADDGISQRANGLPESVVWGLAHGQDLGGNRLIIFDDRLDFIDRRHSLDQRQDFANDIGKGRKFLGGCEYFFQNLG